jgi:hypothetical protein
MELLTSKDVEPHLLLLGFRKKITWFSEPAIVSYRYGPRVNSLVMVIVHERNYSCYYLSKRVYCHSPDEVVKWATRAAQSLGERGTVEIGVRPDDY